MASLSLTIPNPRAPNWSPDDDGILRETFPAGGSLACAAALPGRTRAAIKRRASILNVARAPEWRKRPLTSVIGSCAPKRPAIDRWRDGFDVVGECWVWRGAKSTKGYATFRDDSGKKVSVHRFAYQQFVGPIPDGLVLDHLCRNPGCCNPAHLEAVTNQVNVLRGARGQVKLTVTHCKRGHEFSTENTRIDAHGSRNCKTCARDRGRIYDRQRAARARA